MEGRNGSGKTSLLHILCGIRRPDAGEVAWAGTPIGELGPAYYEHVAYVGHADGVKGDLTATENLETARALGAPGETGIAAALERLRLGDYEDTLARNLSAGQRRRLALARLLVTRARLWILDEPFTSMDKDGIVLFSQVMAEHVGGGGLLVLTSHHDLDLGVTDLRRVKLSP